MNEYQLEAQRKYLVKLRKRKQREKSKLMSCNQPIPTNGAAAAALRPLSRVSSSRRM